MGRPVDGDDDDGVSDASHGETTKSVLLHWQPMLDEELQEHRSPARVIERATAGVDVRAVTIGTVLMLVIVMVMRPDFVLRAGLTRFDTPTLDPVKLLLFAILVAVALAYLTRRH